MMLWQGAVAFELWTPCKNKENLMSIRLVTVRDVVLGEGMPKVCVPVTARTHPELVAQAALASAAGPDLVEWRVDFFDEVTDPAAVLSALDALRRGLGEIPLVFTFRSAREGGRRELPEAEYVALIERASASGFVDVVDVELFTSEAAVRSVVASAHAHAVAVIVSSHDFDATPPTAELVARLRRAQELGADLPKLAVMPTGPRDVLALLEATWTMASTYAEVPIITMSMGGDGVITRLAGEVFGSALTFAAVGATSAPGQVDVETVARVLALIHANR